MKKIGGYPHNGCPTDMSTGTRQIFIQRVGYRGATTRTLPAPLTSLGPTNPTKKIDVYLQPLIDDLQKLWSEGVMTYDISTRENFVMRACLMWTINDFPTYAMLSGWGTKGKLACLQQKVEHSTLQVANPT